MTREADREELRKKLRELEETAPRDPESRRIVRELLNQPSESDPRISWFVEQCLRVLEKNRDAAVDSDYTQLLEEYGWIENGRLLTREEWFMRYPDGIPTKRESEQ